MFWLGHADRSMSDRYDKVGEGADVAVPREASEEDGGWGCPTEAVKGGEVMRAVFARRSKFVVRLLVRLSERFQDCL
jgi:hypothetical protein